MRNCSGNAIYRFALCFIIFMLGPTCIRAHAQETCNQFGTITDPMSPFTFQNNFYASSPNGTQCINVNNRASGFFGITNSDTQPTNGAPGGYPSIYVGCHWGSCTNAAISNLPAQVSDLTTADTDWAVNPVDDGGAWDIAYDIWFNQSSSTNGQPNGTEVMIWLRHSGTTQPAGQKVDNVTINGINFDVWVDPVNQGSFNNIWNIVSFVATTPVNRVDFELLPFFQDAENRGMLQSSWWLISVEAGFEPWSGGSNLQSTDFSFSLSKYSQGGGGADLIPGRWYTVVNNNSGDCLDANGQGTAYGTALIQWPCNGQTNQQWEFQSVGGGYYVVHNRNALGLEWDANGAATSNGTAIDLWGYNTQGNDEWYAEDLGGGRFSFVNSLSSRCLDVPGASTSAGIQLQLYDCNSSPAQVYSLNAQP